MTFKEKIVRLRKLKGLTQDEFASAVGVSRQAVYKWESGQSYPEVPKLLEIKLLFGVGIDELLDESYEVVLPEKKKKRVSKAERERIEKEVRKEEAAEEDVTVSQEPTEAPSKAEIKEEAKTEMKEAVKEEAAPVKEPEEEKQEKRGFFSRIFGRK